MKKRSENGYRKDSIATLEAGEGKPMWSRAAGKMMPIEKTKRIDPNSAEGKAIAARYH